MALYNTWFVSIDWLPWKTIAVGLAKKKKKYTSSYWNMDQYEKLPLRKAYILME